MVTVVDQHVSIFNLVFGCTRIGFQVIDGKFPEILYVLFSWHFVEIIDLEFLENTLAIFLRMCRLPRIRHLLSRDFTEWTC